MTKFQLKNKRAQRVYTNQCRDRKGYNDTKSKSDRRAGKRSLKAYNRAKTI